MESKEHTTVSPEICDPIILPWEGLNIDGDRKFSVQFKGESGNWILALPQKEQLLMTKDRATEAIYKMERVSIIAGFYFTKYRIVEFFNPNI